MYRFMVHRRFRQEMNKIYTLDSLAEILKREKANGKRIVLCHGVFDLLHLGHIRHLQEANLRTLIGSIGFMFPSRSAVAIGSRKYRKCPSKNCRLAHPDLSCCPIIR